MIPDLINYKTSFLNPALKLLVPAIFLLGSYYFFRMRTQYQGEIGTVVKRLALVGLIGFFATSFRYAADIWFTAWKWGESLGFLAFALANVYAVWPLLALIQEIKQDANQIKK